MIDVKCKKKKGAEIVTIRNHFFVLRDTCLFKENLYTVPDILDLDQKGGGSVVAYTVSPDFLVTEKPNDEDYEFFVSSSVCDLEPFINIIRHHFSENRTIRDAFFYPESTGWRVIVHKQYRDMFLFELFRMTILENMYHDN